MRLVVQALSIILLCAIAAFLGLGISYQSTMTPRASGGQFSLIYGDGWFVDGAAIRLPDLSTRGNRLDLQLEPRSGGIEPARVRVSVCGETASEFVVEQRKVETVFLRGACHPRIVTFQVLNPFVPSETDSRKLGAKLERATVHSRLVLPIVEEGLFFRTLSAILLLAALLWLVFGNSVIAGGVVLLLPAFFLMAPDLDLFKLASLWLFGVSLLLGCLMYRHLPVPSVHAAPRNLEAVQYTVLAIVVTALGGALRFYGLDFGLPWNFHPDEVPKVNAIMRMVDNGDLNPRYFLHPTLLLYCTYFVNTLFHLFGMEGNFRDSLVLAGRTVSALGGTLSIFLTYCIGRRLLSAPAGLLAAAILAVLPLHVTCSRYLKEDVLLLTFILAGTAVMVRAVQEQRPRQLLLAGLLMGCAMSVKYSGLLGAGILVAAPWLASRRLTPDPAFFRWTVAAGLCMPVAFVVCSPYVVLYSARFVNDFLSEARHMKRGHGGEITAWSQLWMYHFGRSSLPGASILVSVLGVAGAALLILKRRVEGLLIVWALLVFYLPAEWVRAKPAPQPERYIVPCMPFLALAAAALWDGARTVVRIPLVIGGVALALVMTPAVRSVELATELTNDTRLRMAKWIRHNIPPGSTIYMDWKPYNPRLDEQTYNVVYLDRATILQQLQLEELAKRGRGFLSLSSLYYDRHFSQPNSPTMPRLVFRNVFEKLPLVHEIVPKTGTYGFHNPTLRLYALTSEDALVASR